MAYPGFIVIGAIAAYFIFAYMRNKQANRNDERRERLQNRYDELIETLSAKKKEDESETNIK